MAWKVTLIGGRQFPTLTAARRAMKDHSGLAFCRTCHHQLTPPEFKVEMVEKIDDHKLSGTILMQPPVCPRHTFITVTFILSPEAVEELKKEPE
jgi:hypothetical protein